MPFWGPDMTHRIFEEELMDRPDCDLVKLKKTIKQFGLLNRLFSASRRFFKKEIFPWIRRDPKREYTLLDVGAGGCDIPIWVARQARKEGWRIKITALDYDRRIVPWAREAVREFPEITVVEGSAFELERYGEFDFAFTNHVLHHLSWDQITLVVGKLLRQTRIAFVLNDIKRSRAAYLGYTIFTSLFVRGSLAFYDGRLSIRRGFLAEEWKAWIETHFPDAGIRLLRANPSRLALVWRADSTPS